MGPSLFNTAQYSAELSSLFTGKEWDFGQQSLILMVNSTMGTPTPRLCPVVQWSVHWALSRMTRVLVLAGATCCALETCGKKNASSACRLG